MMPREKRHGASMLWKGGKKLKEELEKDRKGETGRRVKTDIFTCKLAHTYKHVFHTAALLHKNCIKHCIHKTLYTHTNAFKYRRFYTQAPLRTDAFLHKTLYTQTPSHTWIHLEARLKKRMKWDEIRSCHVMLCHVMSCCVTMSCRHGWFLALSPGHVPHLKIRLELSSLASSLAIHQISPCWYPLVQFFFTRAHTHTHFCTQTLSHAEAFTRRHFYT